MVDLRHRRHLVSQQFTNKIKILSSVEGLRFLHISLQYTSVTSSGQPNKMNTFFTQTEVLATKYKILAHLGRKEEPRLLRSNALGADSCLIDGFQCSR